MGNDDGGSLRRLWKFVAGSEGVDCAPARVYSVGDVGRDTDLRPGNEKAGSRGEGEAGLEGARARERGLPLSVTTEGEACHHKRVRNS